MPATQFLLHRLGTHSVRYFFPSRTIMIGHPASLAQILGRSEWTTNPAILFKIFLRNIFEVKSHRIPALSMAKTPKSLPRTTSKTSSHGIFSV
jgi:hypothetical protein